MFEEEQQIPVKWLDTKCYVRVDGDNLPQLIRIEPMFADDGKTLIPQSVWVYIDNQSPMVLDRGSAEALIMASYCTPLPVNAHYKHKKVN